MTASVIEMPAPPKFSEQPAPRADSGEDFEALGRGLSVEADLLRDLKTALIAQRAALAADDTAGLEEVVNHIGRTLLTIREARRQRALLIELVVGGPNASLADAAAKIGGDAAQQFRGRCRDLHDLAVSVSRELTINQAVIRRAIESGEQYLQQLLTVPPVDGYSERPGEARSGLLLNQSA